MVKKLLISLLIVCGATGCATTKKDIVPPSVSTAQVIQSLTDTKTVLVEAGDQNTIVAQKIDKALTLAEKLDALLAQIEKDAADAANKNVIKSE